MCLMLSRALFFCLSCGHFTLGVTANMNWICAHCSYQTDTNDYLRSFPDVSWTNRHGLTFPFLFLFVLDSHFPCSISMIASSISSITITLPYVWLQIFLLSVSRSSNVLISRPIPLHIA